MSESSLVGGEPLAVVGHDFRPLSGEEIKQILRGKTIRSNSTPARPAYIFDEKFKNDGMWISARQKRMSTTMQGKWWISGNQICVAIEGKSEECRSVKIRKKDGALLIVDLGDVDRREVIVTLEQGQDK